MAWYIGQSLPMMVVAFLTGLLVGYLLWGRRYRRLEQAEAVRAVDPATVLPHRGSATGSAPAVKAAAAVPVAAAEPVADADEADEAAEVDEPAAASAAEFADDAAADDAAAGESEVEHADEPAAEAADDPDAASDETDDEAAEDEDHDVTADAAVHEVHEVDGAAGVEAIAEEPDDVEPPTAAEIAALADAAPADPAPAAAEGHGAEPESLFAAAGQPEPAPAPTTGTSDRLERIEGIGPKIALALRTAGIRTFEDLAAADESTLRDALADANLRFAPSLTTWAQQARLLADGDHEGHAALTEQLVAGRAPKAQ